MMGIKGILFDKDGTLFDFSATWTTWAAQTIDDLAEGDADLHRKIAAALEFDLEAGDFLPGSRVIAGTVAEQAEAIAPLFPDRSAASLEVQFTELAAEVTQVEVTPLPAFFAELKALGLKVGVATNDADFSARRHLESVGALDPLDFLAGYDSGHGFKPGPGQLLAFADHVGLKVTEIAMVGDSTHDLLAARAANMTAIGVLTGPADHATLAPHADVVLPSIRDLPNWLNASPK